MTKKQTSILTAIGVLLFVLLFLNSQRFWLRFDLSSGKAYSLTDTSKMLYKEIDERITITYYLSDKLARMHPAPNGIIDLLREYESNSRGRIRVVVEDPAEKGSAAAAERLGVLPQRIQSAKQNESSVAKVYTGIVIEYLNRTDVIPVAFSIDTLEYDVTSRIRSLVRNKPRIVGVVAASGNMEWQTDFSLLAGALESNGYEAREIQLEGSVPADISALFVFGGASELRDAELSVVERYIRSGGGVMFAVEGVAVDSKNDLRAYPVSSSPLLSLLERYGVFVHRELALDKASLTIPYQYRSPSGTMEARQIRYPHWIAVLADSVSKSHPLTARFPGLDLYWPSPLSLVPVPGLVQEVVASTTGRAWRMKKEFATAPEMEAAFTAEEDATRGKIPLVVALSGIFPSAGSTEPGQPLPKAPRPSRVAVIADSDFAGPLVGITRSERNLDFAVTVADWLSHDDDLLAIRNRTSRSMRLDRIEDPAERSRNIVGAYATNIVFIPLAVIFFGLYRAAKRNKIRKGGAR